MNHAILTTIYYMLSVDTTPYLIPLFFALIYIFFKQKVKADDDDDDEECKKLRTFATRF